MNAMPSIPRFVDRTMSAKCRGIAVLVCASLMFGGSANSGPVTRLVPITDGIGTYGDEAGTAIALLGDTLAVSAPSAQPTPYIPTGAIEVYRLNSGVWQSEAVLRPADPNGSLAFGSALALGQDLAVAGTGSNPGSLYTFARTGTSWQQIDKLATATYGISNLSLSGDTLFVNGQYEYLRSGNSWSLHSQLAFDQGESGGVAAIDGDNVAAVSAVISPPSPAATQSFYLYFFSRVGGNWVRQTKFNLGTHIGYLADFRAPVVLAGTTAIVSTPIGVSAFEQISGSWTSHGGLDPLTNQPGFGASLALSGDFAAVGSPDDTVLGFPMGGTAYVFTRSGNAWSRTAHVADPQVSDFYYHFGTALALDGDQLIVGAPGGNTKAGPSGKTTVFAYQGGSWTPTQAVDMGNSHINERFGSSVSASGSTLLIGGESARSVSPFVTGAAYILQQGGTGWLQEVRLTPPAPPTGQSRSFGSSVALDGDTAVVGADRIDNPTGGAYVYTRGGGTWPLQAVLTASSPIGLGWSAALQGDVLALGTGPAAAPGTVQIFSRSGVDWTAQVALQASDGMNGDEFGTTLAMDAGTLLVGAPGEDVGIEQDAGAVYVYTQSGSTWTQQAKLIAPIPAGGNGFGVAVALAGDTAVIGANTEIGEVANPGTRGAAYVYLRTGTSWSLQSVLTPQGLSPGSFGRAVSVSVSGDRAVIGAPYSGDVTSNGRVYVFNRSGSTWTQALQLQGPPQTGYHPDSDQFGMSVAVRGEQAMIGATADGSTGAVFLFGIGDALFADGFESP